MILTLQVVGARAQDLGAASRKVFKAIGGTIGRLPDNDWVFPDPYVSGRHALIRYVNGTFFIEDTSTNGVFVNSLDRRLAKAQAHALRDGDRLYIDAYEIEVSIMEDPARKSRHDPFAEPRTTSPNDVTRFKGDHTASLAIDEFEALDDLEEEDEDLAHGTEWFGSQEMASRSPAIRPSRDPVPFSTVEPRPITRKPASANVAPPLPQAPSAGATYAGDRFETMLAAAGIEGLDASHEAAEVLGELLRSSVGGVMEMLRARERMKDELRIRGTTFKAAHNNPLKFSANVDDAFHNLLVKRNPAYLAPTDALEDAFHDVRDHQSAFLTAMRLAFEAMLARFDPGRLQDDFDRQLKKGSILGVPAKLRYWDLYRERYGEIAKDAEASFRTLFAEEFAKAYEEQLARLRALGHD
jgi:type VI secretion system FHA domain protein